MTSYMLLLLVLLPLIGACFVLSAKTERNHVSQNVYNVAIWTEAFLIAHILHIFSGFDIEKKGIQIVEKYNWLDFPPVEILLAADVFSMLLLLSVNLSFLIAVICLNRTIDRAKTLMATVLLFVGLFNGYLVAADIISFYIFFAALSAPLIILISTFGSQKKKNILSRFSLYNLIGAFLLLIAVVMIYNYKQSNIPLNTAGNLNLRGKTEYFVWFSIFFAFISRLPIWPFHYWISSINSGQRNPLVFIVGNLISFIGLYGFVRFWPNTVPTTIGTYAPIFESVCIITMLFISLISLSHKDVRYKLFAYTTVYYLLYLTGVFLPTGILKQNIGYSLFSYMMIINVLSFLISHIEQQKKQLNIAGLNGVLCYMPRASKCLSLFILAGIGLPVTPLFWNNFIIISEIFNYNLIMGTLVVLSIFIVALAMLEDLYKLKDKSNATKACVEGTDLSNLHFGVYITCLIILFFSFFKPLCFVF